MRVKCINNKIIENELTEGKIYLVEYETYENYKIIDDNNQIRYYCKLRFIEVPEDNDLPEDNELPENNEVNKKDNNIKVRCIDDEGKYIYLTKNKIYDVIKEKGDWYYILDDNFSINRHLKYRFIEVPENN